MQERCSKVPLLNQCFKVRIGRGDHSNVDFRRARLANSSHLASLDTAKKHRLDIDWSLADFVEKQGTAACSRKEATVVRTGPSERALDMAKQLRRCCTRCESCHVDCDERSRPAGSGLMNRGSNQFFSGSGRASNQHVGVGLRCSFDLLDELANFSANTDESKALAATTPFGPATKNEKGPIGHRESYPSNQLIVAEHAFRIDRNASHFDDGPVVGWHDRDDISVAVNLKRTPRDRAVGKRERAVGAYKFRLEPRYFSSPTRRCAQRCRVTNPRRIGVMSDGQRERSIVPALSALRPRRSHGCRVDRAHPRSISRARAINGWGRESVLTEAGPPLSL